MNYLQFMIQPVFRPIPIIFMAIIIMDSYHFRLDISIESVANSSGNFFLADDWLIVVYIKQRFTAIKHLHCWSVK